MVFEWLHFFSQIFKRQNPVEIELDAMSLFLHKQNDESEIRGVKDVKKCTFYIILIIIYVFEMHKAMFHPVKRREFSISSRTKKTSSLLN
jgi:hypothetical protein